MVLFQYDEMKKVGKICWSGTISLGNKPFWTAFQFVAVGHKSCYGPPQICHASISNEYSRSPYYAERQAFSRFIGEALLQLWVSCLLCFMCQTSMNASSLMAPVLTMAALTLWARFAVSAAVATFSTASPGSVKVKNTPFIIPLHSIIPLH